MTEPVVHDNIEMALVSAQAQISAAKKDGRNDYSKWMYVKAETLIAMSKHVFNDNGLAFDRKSDKLVYLNGFPVIESIFNLTHGPSQTVTEYTSSFPVVEKKGTALDRAYSASLTSGLAYKIRDVLQIPREEEGGGVDARDDRQHVPHNQQQQQNNQQQQQQNNQQQQQQPPKPPPEPTISKARAWPEMVEKYKTLLPLVGMNLIQFGNLTKEGFATIKVKIEEKQKAEEEATAKGG